ncbi:MAG: hypothetical protein IJS73_03240 [Paludibacteraceae bacterium]|nr:hypothetical protein [Paludibacteraceae bacterium]
MKKTLLFFAFVASIFSAYATQYHKINSFPIDGQDIQDTFLIVVEYAGNTYIWNGQEATGKNYVCLQNFSSDVIEGDYTDNEIRIVHNKWHSYYKLFSVLCKGDGDRDAKGGYYLGGVSGTNGISFNNGQVDCEITFEDTEGIKIATKSGLGIFRFNITPNDPHGFKFYQNETNMLYPTLYVKGNNTRYAQQVEYEDMSDDYNYAQYDYYDDKTQKAGKIHDCDFRLTAEDNDNAYPQIYLKVTNSSRTSIAGTYSSAVKDGQPWQVYCTNSSAKGSTYTFVSNNGNITALYLKHCSLTLTPLRKNADGVTVYLIDLKWVDQNNKHRKVYKELPIYGQLTTFTEDNESSEQIFFDEELPTDILTVEDIEITVLQKTIYANSPFSIYSLDGRDVTSLNGSLKQGCYIVRTANKSVKTIIL